MEAEEEDMSPFWLQTSNRQRRLRRTSSLLLNSGFLLVFLLCIVFVVVFIVIPTLLSFTSQIFKPHLVKRSWEYLNLILVLFAIVCGFFRGAGNNSNNNNNSDYVTTSYDEDHKFVNRSHDDQKSSSNPSTPHHWYDYQTDQTAYKTLQRLRSSSSYPDLRLESPWLITSDDRWRFYDDTRVNNYRFLTSDQLHHRRPRLDEEEEQQQHPYQLVESVGNNNKSGLVEEEDAPLPPSPSPPPSPPRLLPQHSSPPRSPPPLAPPSPPPLPPQPIVVKRKVKRTYNDLPPKERPTENKHLNVKAYQLPPPSPPPPPPPPPPPEYYSKNKKKRGGASATKDLILASLRRKKKKQRQKSVEDLNFLFNPEESTSIFPSDPPPSPPPPPPPPPPPTVFFQNLFSPKRGKTQARVHSFSPLSQPSPPPPLEARASKTNAQKTPITAQKPPPPAKTTAYNTYTGNESPLNIRIPPPPPPPPFKMAGWKFVVQGDYVRIKSNNNSPRSESSAELDGGDESDQPSTPSDGGDSPVMTSSTSPLFCPSPDVNTKADNFIAKFRAGLRLEKMNSVRARSNLGLGSSSNPVTE